MALRKRCHFKFDFLSNLWYNIDREKVKGDWNGTTRGEVSCMSSDIRHK